MVNYSSFDEGEAETQALTVSIQIQYKEKGHYPVFSRSWGKPWSSLWIQEIPGDMLPLLFAFHLESDFCCLTFLYNSWQEKLLKTAQEFQFYTYNCD